MQYTTLSGMILIDLGINKNPATQDAHWVVSSQSNSSEFEAYGSVFHDPLDLTCFKWLDCSKAAKKWARKVL